MLKANKHIKKDHKTGLSNLELVSRFFIYAL